MRRQSRFQVWHDRGFLPKPDPLTRLDDVESDLSPETVDCLESMIKDMPRQIDSAPDELRKSLDALPVFDIPQLEHSHVCERLFLIYAFLANAYVYADPQNPRSSLPPGIAVPFYQVAHMLERPPILNYGALVLYNWRRLDPHAPIALGNLATLDGFHENLPDEAWFALVHVNVEANAAEAIAGIQDALDGAADDDTMRVESGLTRIADGIGLMLEAFHRMPEGCDPDVYHRRVRPYMFGLNNITFEGVEAYRGKPQTLNGGSGAQSSTIPAIVAALGIQHEKTDLMRHLDRMQDHVPKPHRDFIRHIQESACVREFLLANRSNGALKDAYNGCLRRLIIFRRAHLHYARVYIFDKVANPVGTGGTPFMDWLTKLTQETEAHLI